MEVGQHFIEDDNGIITNKETGKKLVPNEVVDKKIRTFKIILIILLAVIIPIIVSGLMYSGYILYKQNNTIIRLSKQIEENKNKLDEEIANRSKKKNDLQNKGVIPKGSIIMWSGQKIPDGFVLCDGKNGTPNLKDKFIVGSGSKYKLGDKGGNDEIKLTLEQIPSHSHIIEYSTQSAWINGETSSISGISTDYKNIINKVKTSKIGEGKEIDIRPQYYALAFIMKI